MLKNPTPYQIAVYTAVLITAILTLLFVGIKLLVGADFDWYYLPLFSLLTFAINFLTISEALKRYIYRRIKLVYKTIHKLKSPKENKLSQISLQDHIIDEVEQEVFDWANNQAREIEDLKKLEAYRRDFIGNISHELKTPLFNIQGYLDTLVEGGLEDPQINRNFLIRAIKNVERLNNIVEDLDMISNIEAGELQLDIQKFDIRELSYEIFEELEISALDRNINLKIKDGCDFPFVVEADRERIRQVLVNLISNSIKYGKQNGRTQIGFYNMDQNILIEVSDDGLGIAKSHLPRLFERFYRVDKSRSREQGGTGLGLAIVKHLVEAHKQTINVRSTEGLGSTFGFTLKSA
ncbi:MAG: ATP-binding protein [Bacteroidota bacterium]